MKTKIILLTLAAAAVIFILTGLPTAQAAGAPGSGIESPIGRLVDIQLVAWPLSTGVAGRVNGSLIGMQPGWLIVKEGSYEHWLPTEKVMSMRVTR